MFSSQLAVAFFPDFVGTIMHILACYLLTCWSVLYGKSLVCVLFHQSVVMCKKKHNQDTLISKQLYESTRSGILQREPLKVIDVIVTHSSQKTLRLLDGAIATKETDHHHHCTDSDQDVDTWTDRWTENIDWLVSMATHIHLQVLETFTFCYWEKN